MPHSVPEFHPRIELSGVSGRVSRDIETGRLKAVRSRRLDLMCSRCVGSGNRIWDAPHGWIEELCPMKGLSTSGAATSENLVFWSGEPQSSNIKFGGLMPQRKVLENLLILQELHFRQVSSTDLCGVPKNRIPALGVAWRRPQIEYVAVSRRVLCVRTDCSM